MNNKQLKSVETNYKVIKPLKRFDNFVRRIVGEFLTFISELKLNFEALHGVTKIIITSRLC